MHATPSRLGFSKKKIVCNPCREIPGTGEVKSLQKLAALGPKLAALAPKELKDFATAFGKDGMDAAAQLEALVPRGARDLCMVLGKLLFYCFY